MEKKTLKGKNTWNSPQDLPQQLRSPSLCEEEKKNLKPGKKIVRKDLN